MRLIDRILLLLGLVRRSHYEFMREVDQAHIKILAKRIDHLEKKLLSTTNGTSMLNPGRIVVHTSNNE
jgi:hypothetical protein